MLYIIKVENWFPFCDFQVSQILRYLIFLPAKQNVVLQAVQPTMLPVFRAAPRIRLKNIRKKFGWHIFFGILTVTNEKETKNNVEKYAELYKQETEQISAGADAGKYSCKQQRKTLDAGREQQSGAY